MPVLLKLTWSSIIINIIGVATNMDCLPHHGHATGLRAPTTTLKEKMMTTCTNLAYRLELMKGIDPVSRLLAPESAAGNVVLLGKYYPNKEALQQSIRTIIWFTHRKNIKISEGINSDVGWGCLPRVGQMVLAQSLATFFTAQGQPFSQELRERIIKPFVDNSDGEAKYSLSSMLKYARREYQMAPGEWFRIGQVGSIIQKMHSDSPMPGSQRLKIQYFGDSVIFLDQVLALLDTGEYRDGQDISQGESKNEEGNTREKDNHVLLIITARAGQKSVSVKAYEQVQELLGLECSTGIIGGVPAKALYIVGCHKGEVIYLDPHYVHDYAEVGDLKKDIDSYSSSYRSLGYEKLDPCMALFFHLKGKKDLNELAQKVEELAGKHGSSALISVMDRSLFQFGSLKKAVESQSLEFTDISELMNTAN